MPDSPPPTTLAWLRQTAAVDGAAYSQVLLHLLERVEALEQRPIPGFVELAAPTPEAAPVATDKEQPLPPHIAITYQPKSVYQPLRPAQRPAPQPAPPAAPARGLVERVADVIGDDAWLPEARAAIREVAAWLRENEVGYNAARWLEQEADR
jgi:hypothetical protein